MSPAPLLPCPFCGCASLSTQKPGLQWAVYCHGCGASGPASGICGEDDDADRDEARRLWNAATRPEVAHE